ncbi:hypothetical protein CROQUDRAFT_130161 [Cronartium quercuum f. sp. fusiforme G11]|uniref:SAP domain-containing protein n=1 Tax=Cronartium quercuum f. sp. fusiforme G11 TaxID=708437 RepID=A0A9P6NVP9_9BASI|nr:hypothetical protein CROQUDRAFT_130161 [Cronartium quercuum f. sp. fusiforme G11]
MSTPTSTPTKASLTALKVADLKALCVKANLPVSGNKTELVNRLLSANSSSASPAVNSSPAPPASALSQPASFISAQAAVAPPSAASTYTVPQATTASVMKSVAPENTSQTSQTSLPASQATQVTSELGPVSDTDGIANERQKAIQEEISKRAQRAQRFGLVSSENPTDQEELKKLERAKKFGAEITTIKIDALDRALGERGDRSNRTTTSATNVSVVPKPTTLSQSELEWEERKRKRAEKFGISVKAAPVVENKKARV